MRRTRLLTAPPFTGRPVTHDRQTTTPTKPRRQQRADRPARVPIAFADQRQPQTNAAEIATATGRTKTAAMKRSVSPATIERVAQHIENTPVFSKRAQRELSRVMHRLENQILSD